MSRHNSNTHRQHAPPARPAVLRRWQLAPGSLSRRLAALGREFRVQTLFQGIARLHRREAAELGQRGGLSLVREVMLWVDQQPLVWARSVLPAHAVRGPWRGLLGLGKGPLANLLYADRRVQRSPLKAFRLRPHGPEHRRLAQGWQQATGQPLPARTGHARSSVFHRHGAPLRVMEVLSPRLAAHPSRSTQRLLRQVMRRKHR